MRVALLAAAILLAMSATALAGSVTREIQIDRLGPPVTLPATQADLDRSEHVIDRSTRFDNMANHLGIKDGGAEFFEYDVLGKGRGSNLVGGIGGNGVTFRLRW